MGTFTDNSKIKSMEFDENGSDDREKMNEENTALLIKIAELCRKSERDNPEVFFLLGNSGVGKSALINTVIKALTGCYYPRAQMGKGSTASKTLTLHRFENCGVKAKDIVDDTHRDIVAKVLHQLPTIYDAAGKGDIDTPELREIIEMIIRGFIPPGTSIESLEANQGKYGVGCLKDIYKESKPEWRVTKVVFVHGCNAVIPKNLVKCLESVLKKVDPNTGMMLCQCDTFVVLTKYDLVREQTKYEAQDDDTISMEEFRDVERSMAKVFSIEGAVEHNSIKWVSYVDGHGDDNPFVDNIALKFLVKMLMHGTSTPPSQKGAKELVSLPTHVWLMLKKQIREMTNTNYEMSVNPCTILIGILFAIGVYCFICLLTKPV